MYCTRLFRSSTVGWVDHAESTTTHKSIAGWHNRSGVICFRWRCMVLSSCGLEMFLGSNRANGRFLIHTTQLEL